MQKITNEIYLDGDEFVVFDETGSVLLTEKTFEQANKSLEEYAKELEKENEESLETNEIDVIVKGLLDNGTYKEAVVRFAYKGNDTSEIVQQIDSIRNTITQSFSNGINSCMVIGETIFNVKSFVSFDIIVNLVEKEK